MINRRDFLGTAAGATLGGLLFSRPGSSVTLPPVTGISNIGVQLYTVRREMEKDFEGTLAKIASIGFKEVEFAGYFNRTPAQVRAVLDANKLAAPAAHIGLKSLREDWEKTIETAKAVGHKYLVVAYLLPEERKSIDDYKKYAEMFNKAAEDSRKAGIQFAYHNHDFEFMPLDGQMPYDLLLERTDPKLVKMELDLYWITKAKQSPAKYFAAHPGRFPLFHVKDMDNTPKGFFTEVGRGVIDFKSIFAQSKKAGTKHYFVEQDETPGPPLESLKISYENLKKMQW